MKAASPQAPTADYYMGDDVYHNGAFMLGANFGFYSGFVARSGAPEPPRPALRFDPGTADMYDFQKALASKTMKYDDLNGARRLPPAF